MDYQHNYRKSLLLKRRSTSQANIHQDSACHRMAVHSQDQRQEVEGGHHKVKLLHPQR